MRIKQTGKALSAFLSGQNAPVSAALHGWTHPAVQIRLEATFEGAIKRNAATPVLDPNLQEGLATVVVEHLGYDTCQPWTTY